jgi:hypothetical protein
MEPLHSSDRLANHDPLLYTTTARRWMIVGGCLNVRAIQELKVEPKQSAHMEIPNSNRREDRRNRVKFRRTEKRVLTPVVDQLARRAVIHPEAFGRTNRKGSPVFVELYPENDRFWRQGKRVSSVHGIAENNGMSETPGSCKIYHTAKGRAIQQLPAACRRCEVLSSNALSGYCEAFVATEGHS